MEPSIDQTVTFDSIGDSALHNSNMVSENFSTG